MNMETEPPFDGSTLFHRFNVDQKIWTM